MTIKECYLALEGDYEGMLSRFLTEARIRKFLIKFLDDTSFQTLQNAIEEGNTGDALRAAHTLKGVAQNLGLEKLLHSAHLITNILYAGDLSQAVILLPQVQEAYDITIQTIRMLQSSMEA